MKLLLLFGLGVYGMAEVVRDTTPGPSMFDNTGQITLAAIYLLGSGLNAWLTVRKDKLAMKREETARQWLIEDRKEADLKAEKQADRIRTELTREADRIASDAWERTDVITKKIDDNTKISTDAFTAANNVNEKIAAVGALRRAAPGSERRSGDQTRETNGEPTE